MFEGPATGFDADALDILKAFSVNQGPDVYVAAHEWVGEFAKSGYAMDMEDFVEANPWAFADVIPVLWEATKYQGKIHAIPQDSEIRMFFYNKDMLRKIGKDEAFIEGLPDAGREGRVHDGRPLQPRQGGGRQGRGRDRHHPPAERRPRLPDDVRRLRREVHRRGDRASCCCPRPRCKRALEWFDWNAKNGVTPENNTAMSWDEIQAAFKKEKAFIYHQGVWAVPEWQLGDAKGAHLADRRGRLLQEDRLDPRAGAGARAASPTNLSHPIVYVVNPQSPNAELAAMLVAYATLPYYNTQHAVTTAHTGDDLNGQASMPAYEDAWYLGAATPLLARSTFMPEPSRFRPLQRHPLQGAAGRRDRPADARRRRSTSSRTR